MFIFQLNNCSFYVYDIWFIDGGGCSYYGKNAVDVSWVSLPHFYKKGSIIVQYDGENNYIISDLDAILDAQFAGYTP